MELKTGDKAPDFALYDTDRHLVSLGDFKGRNLVILFFPFAFTGTCTKELCSVKDEYSDYTDLNAEVVAISIDSHHALKAYKEMYSYNFRLLSDFNKVTSTEYNSIYEVFGLGDMKGVSKRSAFVVDGNGVLQYVEVLENAGEIPDISAIKATLAGIAV